MKQEIKTVKQLLKESDSTLDDLLDMEVMVQHQNQKPTTLMSIFDIYNRGFEMIQESLSKVAKHQNILVAMMNFLLSRYYDLADIHRADLDLDAIEDDKAKMREKFENINKKSL